MPASFQPRFGLVEMGRVASVRCRTWKVGQRPEPRGGDAMLCAVDAANNLLTIEHHGPIVRASAGDLRAAEDERLLALGGCSPLRLIRQAYD